MPNLNPDECRVHTSVVDRISSTTQASFVLCRRRLWVVRREGKFSDFDLRKTPGGGGGGAGRDPPPHIISLLIVYIS